MKLYIMYEGQVEKGNTADAEVLASVTNEDELKEIEAVYQHHPHTWFAFELSGKQLLNGRVYTEHEEII